MPPRYAILIVMNDKEVFIKQFSIFTKNLQKKRKKIKIKFQRKRERKSVRK